MPLPDVDVLTPNAPFFSVTMLQAVKCFLGLYREKPQNIILVGVGYNSHSFSKSINARQELHVVACIDDEPWNHLTEMNGAVVHYPSELLALIKKHNVVAVIMFDGEKLDFDDQIKSACDEKQVLLISVADEVSDKISFIRDRLVYH